ncbi:MAG: hypothetical protein H0W86_04550 [Armatimonadetes bacterium]|nr:hypothetical protein [Armatimonadota bacterium]
MACLYVGLAAFVILSFWPGHKETAVAVTLLTPLGASFATGVELLIRRHTYAGLSLLTAVAIIVLALVIGVRL